ncbi:NAD(P)H-dependent oxidoreductase [Priestia abyssalis]|uniref:NAD(P)H-dependent oxidoreductase n=1 Tax=Priestia abyssalis TaxID=1221450 RepID=UPI0009950C4E|nr:NAD(P)H-dependent oxidoreductase [Priestia abyssalis]
MNVLIVYAHPEPTSFTAALKDTAVETLEALGHSVELSDLYADGFNPVAGRHDFTTIADPSRFHYQTEQLYASKNKGFSTELTREQERLLKANLMVFVFPIWWGGMPAIMKGWFERVLAYGIAYSDGKRYEQGYFFGKRGILCLTTGGSGKRFSSEGTYGSIEDVLYPTQRCMLEYIGLEVMEPFVAYATPRLDDDARKAYLQNWAVQLRSIVTDASWQDRLEQAKDIQKRNRVISEEQGWSIPR